MGNRIVQSLNSTNDCHYAYEWQLKKIFNPGHKLSFDIKNSYILLRPFKCTSNCVHTNYVWKQNNCIVHTPSFTIIVVCDLQEACLKGCIPFSTFTFTKKRDNEVRFVVSSHGWLHPLQKLHNVSFNPFQASIHVFNLRCDVL